MKIALFGVFATVLTGRLFPLMPSAPLAMGVFALNNMGIGMTSAMGVTALLRIAPGPIKAQTVALYYMCISMAGLFLGPTAVALAQRLCVWCGRYSLLDGGYLRSFLVCRYCLACAVFSDLMIKALLSMRV